MVENPEVVIVPVVFITMGLVLAYALQLFSRLRMQDRDLLNKERLSALEKGINMPFMDMPRAPKSGSSLKTGLLAVAVGIGISVFFYLQQEESAIGIGVIVLLAGAANLLYWHLNGKKEWEQNQNRERVIHEAQLNYLNEMTNKLKQT